MSTCFLVQVNNTGGYPNITKNRLYQNDAWMNKPRDRDHGFVEPGDTLLVYCTADVLSYPMTLAFQVDVVETSPDHVTFHLGEPQWFHNRLKREQILDLVDTGQLDEVFRSCGAQGFNIRRLEPPAAQGVLELLQGESAKIAASMPVAIPTSAAGSPLDRLIETKLEQWLVEHWQEVNFGSKLKLYEEDGKTVGQQYNTGVVGTIDLLCEDEESNALVVIELKRGRPSDEVAGQLARYIG